MARLAGRGTRPRSRAKDRRRRLSCLARNGRRSRGRQSPARLRAGTASVGSKPEEDADRVGPAGERGLKPVHLGPSPRPGRWGRRHPPLQARPLDVRFRGGRARRRQKPLACRIVATDGAGIDMAWKRKSRAGNDHLSAGLADRGAAPDFPGGTRPEAASIWSETGPPARPSRSARTPDRHENARRHAAGAFFGFSG